MTKQTAATILVLMDAALEGRYPEIDGLRIESYGVNGEQCQAVVCREGQGMVKVADRTDDWDVSVYAFGLTPHEAATSLAARFSRTLSKLAR